MISIEGAHWKQQQSNIAQCDDEICKFHDISSCSTLNYAESALTANVWISREIKFWGGTEMVGKL